MKVVENTQISYPQPVFTLVLLLLKEIYEDLKKDHCKNIMHNSMFPLKTLKWQTYLVYTGVHMYIYVYMYIHICIYVQLTQPIRTGFDIIKRFHSLLYIMATFPCFNFEVFLPLPPTPHKKCQLFISCSSFSGESTKQYIGGSQYYRRCYRSTGRHQSGLGASGRGIHIGR